MTAAELAPDPGPGPGSPATHRTGPDDAITSPPASRIPWSGPCLVVAGMAAATYSVVRFDLRIVGTYLVLAVLLGLDLLATRAGRAQPLLAARWVCAVALVLAAVAGWLVPGFTYLTPTAATQVRATSSVAALAAGLALTLPWRRAGQLALGVAVLGYLAGAVAVIRADPAPAIDVWYTLQGAADALGAGQGLYRQTWVGPPGVLGAFTYLPWTAVLLAPGRWLAGDVRVALVALTLASAAVLARLRGPSTRGLGTRGLGARGLGARGLGARGLGLAALLLLLPGTTTQVEQAWTEPLLLAELTGFALALTNRRPGWAVVALALALASKQHIALLLPVLAAWPAFGWRRAAAAVAGAFALVLPWLVTEPRAMLDDTVTLLVHFPALRFADSLYIAAINQLGWTPPLWATGIVVGLTITLACVQVRRADPGLATVLRWCALVLLVANLVNKQAFYNQYWLVAAVVLLSWAVPDPSPRR